MAELLKSSIESTAVSWRADRRCASSAAGCSRPGFGSRTVIRSKRPGEQPLHPASDRESIERIKLLTSENAQRRAPRSARSRTGCETRRADRHRQARTAFAREIDCPRDSTRGAMHDRPGESSSLYSSSAFRRWSSDDLFALVPAQGKEAGGGSQPRRGEGGAICCRQCELEARVRVLERSLPTAESRPRRRSKRFATSRGLRMETRFNEPV